MSISIRDAKLPADKPALLSFIAGSNLFESQWEPDRRLDKALPEDYLPELVARAKAKQGRLIVAEAEGRVVGWAMCYIDQHDTFVRPKDRPYGYIAEMFVEEALRGRHVGRLLLKACEDHFRKLKIKTAIISALCANKRAVNAYVSAGYADYAINLRKVL